MKYEANKKSLQLEAVKGHMKKIYSRKTWVPKRNKGQRITSATFPMELTMYLMHRVGQKFRSGFSVTSYGKTLMNFLANPISCCSPASSSFTGSEVTVTCAVQDISNIPRVFWVYLWTWHVSITSLHKPGQKWRHKKTYCRVFTVFKEVS